MQITRTSRIITAVVGMSAALALAACSSDTEDAAAGQSVVASATAQPSTGVAAELHPTTRAFIDGWNRGSSPAMLDTFTSDAVLIDDNRTFTGKAEIATFTEPEAAGYRIELLDVEATRTDGQRVLVEVKRVADGSGFRATFDFTFRGELIARADLQYA